MCLFPPASPPIGWSKFTLEKFLIIYYFKATLKKFKVNFYPTRLGTEGRFWLVGWLQVGCNRAGVHPRMLVARWWRERSGRAPGVRLRIPSREITPRGRIPSREITPRGLPNPIKTLRALLVQRTYPRVQPCTDLESWIQQSLAICALDSRVMPAIPGNCYACPPLPGNPSMLCWCAHHSRAYQCTCVHLRSAVSARSLEDTHPYNHAPLTP